MHLKVRAINIKYRTVPNDKKKIPHVHLSGTSKPPVGTLSLCRSQVQVYCERFDEHLFSH